MVSDNAQCSRGGLVIKDRMFTTKVYSQTVLDEMHQAAGTDLARWEALTIYSGYGYVCHGL